MEVLTTQATASLAKQLPSPERRLLAESVRLAGAVPSGATPQFRVEPLGERHAIGWRRDPHGVVLWHLGPAAAPLAEPPLATLARGDMLALGIADAEIHERIRAASCLSDLDALSLPAAALDALRMRFIQEVHDLDLASLVLDRRAESLEHFDAFLRGDLRDLLLNLDPSQRRIVELGGAGAILVNGVAGSGKTAVMLHRMRALQQGVHPLKRPRILFISYNRALADASQELHERLGGDTREVEFSTLHGWCMKHFPTAGAPLNSQSQKKLVEEALAQTRPRGPQGAAVWNHPIAFWLDEIQLIQRRVLAGLDEYRTTERIGTGRALRPDARPLVWKVYEAYRRLCGRRSDFDEVIRAAYARLQALGDGAPHWDEVFLDEAQDIAPIALRLVAHLARRGNLFVAYDRAQSIFLRGFRWKDVGIQARGARSFNLSRSHRSTKAILELALEVHRALPAEGDSDEKAELLRPEASDRPGRPPEWIQTPRDGEAAEIARRVRALIEHEGRRPDHIAVLAPSKPLREQVAAALQREHIQCLVLSARERLRFESRVLVATMQACKGLEFPIVHLICGARRFGYKGKTAEADPEAFARDMQSHKLFYVALTRAMEHLVLVHELGNPPPWVGRVREPLFDRPELRVVRWLLEGGAEPSQIAPWEARAVRSRPGIGMRELWREGKFVAWGRGSPDSPLGSTVLLQAADGELEAILQSSGASQRNGPHRLFRRLSKVAPCTGQLQLHDGLIALAEDPELHTRAPTARAPAWGTLCELADQIESGAPISAHLARELTRLSWARAAVARLGLDGLLARYAP